MFLKRKIDRDVYVYGEEILKSVGMNEEKTYIQHGRVTVYEHSLYVASMCMKLTRRLRLKNDRRSLVRGALLHDYFLYDWHIRDQSHRWHGFSHAGRALKNARRDFKLNDVERNMIESHMFPMGGKLPRFRESFTLYVADKICAADETLSGIMCRFKK